MITLNRITEFIEQKLNDGLTADERIYSPFKLYTDIGDAEKAYRISNKVKACRYGIVSVISSGSAPLNSGTLQIYNLGLAVDILVNVDRMAYTENVGEYPEVVKVRGVIDGIAAEQSGVPTSFTSNNASYTAVPVYTLGGAGSYSVQASDLGKVVPITFTVDISLVQNGVNSADVTVEIDDEVIPCTQFGMDMVASTEGQTRSAGGNSKFNIQETTFTISLVTPLVNSDFCRKMIQALHRGGTSEPLSVSITYKGAPFEDIPQHKMHAQAVRLTGAIPDNVGLNVELVEADEVEG